MLQRNLVFRQHIQHVTAETDLAVHQILVDVDGGEVLLAGNTGDGVCRQFLIGAVRHDHGTRLIRCVGVADVDGDACRTYREDRCLMQNRCAHVGQLTQFGIGNGTDHSRIVYDAGIGNQETGNICPVLVQGCLDCAGYDRTGDIAAATGESLDIAVCAAAVKSGDNSIFQNAQTLTKYLFGLFVVQAAVRLEEDDFCGIHKGKAQVCGDDLTVQIFATACGIVLAGTLFEVFCDLRKFCLQRKIHAQTGNDVVVPCLDRIQGIREIQTLFCQVIAGVQHIGHLDVIGKTLARCGRYYIPALRICLDDCCCLLDLLGICQTAAAELYYFRCHMSHTEEKPERSLLTPY